MIPTKEQLNSDFIYDPTSLTEDFVFGGGRTGKGSLVEKLPEPMYSSQFCRALGYARYLAKREEAYNKAMKVIYL